MTHSSTSASSINTSALSGIKDSLAQRISPDPTVNKSLSLLLTYRLALRRIYAESDIRAGPWSPNREERNKARAEARQAVRSALKDNLFEIERYLYEMNGVDLGKLEIHLL
jgi:hypothetical protein